MVGYHPNQPLILWQMQIPLILTNRILIRRLKLPRAIHELMNCMLITDPLPKLGFRMPPLRGFDVSPKNWYPLLVTFPSYNKNLLLGLARTSCQQSLPPLLTIASLWRPNVSTELLFDFLAARKCVIKAEQLSHIHLFGLKCRDLRLHMLLAMYLNFALLQWVGFYFN